MKSTRSTVREPCCRRVAPQRRPRIEMQMVGESSRDESTCDTCCKEASIGLQQVIESG